MAKRKYTTLHETATRPPRRSGDEWDEFVGQLATRKHDDGPDVRAQAIREFSGGIPARRPDDWK